MKISANLIKMKTHLNILTYAIKSKIIKTFDIFFDCLTLQILLLLTIV